MFIGVTLPMHNNNLGETRSIRGQPSIKVFQTKAGFSLANIHAQSDFFLLSKSYLFHLVSAEKGTKKSLRAKIFANGQWKTG